MVAATQERRVKRRTRPDPARFPGRGFRIVQNIGHSIVARLSAVLLALAALRPFAASFIIWNYEVDVADSERAREFE